ncbi:hypothetical protein DFQ01_112105 [Paenibacillus cellulosilyticus]|uniref:DUF839 domain-containing protein n=1 Tax=Paenibacillus cellulosilyticus TaxID=375489 RepID=A0A2V2YRW4_9BACL|nr:alkaline phosphatase PhoX [Paenibacillus cellulosilyticus]PWW00752.1 hypothetical protein DFQ01_112105 [Paenibacillus cellulosilyticus]QKS45607.1 DUF839 domain-containing protein [Paenibacillus cellulosilyticus]
MNYNKDVSRRSFLAMLGTSTAALAAASSGLGPLMETAEASASKLLGSPAALPFPALSAQTADRLSIPSGYSVNILSKDAAGGYAGFWSSGSSNEGRLWVSRSVNADPSKRGASVYDVKRADASSAWSVTAERRVTALDRVRLTGPASGSKTLHNVTVAQGLWSNGTGGRTPWGTVFAGEQAADTGAAKAGLVPVATGWMAEADPADGSFAIRKHTALGRFNHGHAAAVIARDKHAVVYMGSDKALFKFVSDDTYDSQLGSSNSKLLEAGKLYAADLGRGSWIELTVDAVHTKLSDPSFRVPDNVGRLKEDLLDDIQNQADVLVYAQEAALILGATALEQATGVAVHPADQSLFVAQVGSAATGHGFGSVLRLVEEDGNASAARFETDLAVSGSRQAGFSSPSAIAFDSSGRLWIATAIPQAHLNEGAYAPFGNNGLLVLTPKGDTLGKAEAFAYAPVKGMFSAPSFGPEGTLFTATEGADILAIRRS